MLFLIKYVFFDISKVIVLKSYHFHLLLYFSTCDFFHIKEIKFQENIIRLQTWRRLFRIYQHIWLMYINTDTQVYDTLLEHILKVRLISEKSVYISKYIHSLEICIIKVSKLGINSRISPYPFFPSLYYMYMMYILYF